MADDPDRLVDQAGDVEFVEDVRRGISCRDIADHDDVDREQDDIGGIELPCALEYPGGTDKGTALQHDAAVGNRCGVAGDEDERIGSAAESKIPDRDPAHYVVGSLIQKQYPVLNSKKQIESHIARVMRETGLNIHERCSYFGKCRRNQNSANADRIMHARLWPQ